MIDQITMMDYEEYRYHVLASYHHKDLLPKEIAKKLLDEADSIGYEDISSGERFEREAEYLVHIAHELTQGKWDHEFRIMGI
jgi:hypothetical protein